MLGRAIGGLCVLALLAGCGVSPASLGITGPGTALPQSFQAPVGNDDAAVGLPGIPQSGSPYQGTNSPDGAVVHSGDFYGYN